MYKKKTVIFAFLFLLVHIISPYTRDCSAKDVYICHELMQETEFKTQNGIIENPYMVNINMYRLAPKPVNMILKQYHSTDDSILYKGFENVVLELKHRPQEARRDTTDGKTKFIPF